MVLNTPSILRDVPGTQLAVFCWHSDYVSVNNRHFCDISLKREKQTPRRRFLFVLKPVLCQSKYLYTQLCCSSKLCNRVTQRWPRAADITGWSNLSPLAVRGTRVVYQEWSKTVKRCPMNPREYRGLCAPPSIRTPRKYVGRTVFECKKQRSTVAQGLRLNWTPYATSIPLGPFPRRVHIVQQLGQQVILLPIFTMFYGQFWLLNCFDTYKDTHTNKRAHSNQAKDYSHQVILLIILHMFSFLY